MTEACFRAAAALLTRIAPKLQLLPAATLSWPERSDGDAASK